MVLVALPGLRCDRVRVEFLPLVQVIVEGHGHGVALADLVVADRWNAVLVDEAVAAIHAFEKARRMVVPVKQVRARHVAPVVGSLAQLGVLEDVEQVISTLPVNRAIGVERYCDTFRHHEMIGRSGRVAQDSLPDATRLLRAHIAVAGSGCVHASPLAVRFPFHFEQKEPAPDRRTRRYGVDDGRIPVHDHLGIIQDEALVPAATLLVLFPIGRSQVGLGPAGIALPLFGVKGQLPFDVSGRRGGAEVLNRRQDGFLDAHVAYTSLQTGRTYHEVTNDPPLIPSGGTSIFTRNKVEVER